MPYSEAVTALKIMSKIKTLKRSGAKTLNLTQDKIYSRLLLLVFGILLISFIFLTNKIRILSDKSSFKEAIAQQTDLPAPTPTVQPTPEPNDIIKCYGSKGSGCEDLYVEVNSVSCSNGSLVCCDLGSGKPEIRSKTSCQQIYNLLALKASIVKKRAQLASEAYTRYINSINNNINNLSNTNLYQTSLPPTALQDQTNTNYDTDSSYQQFLLKLDQNNSDTTALDNLENNITNQKYDLYSACLGTVKTNYDKYNADFNDPSTNHSLVEKYEDDLKHCEYILN